MEGNSVAIPVVIPPAPRGKNLYADTAPGH